MLETHQSLQEKYEKEITEVSLSKLELTMKLVEIRKQFRNNVDNEYKLRCEMMEKQIIKLWKDKDVLEKELKGSKQVEDLITVLQAKYGVSSPSHKIPTSIPPSLPNNVDNNDDVPLLNAPPKKRQSIKGVTILKEINEDFGSIAESEELNETASEKKNENGEEIENNSSKEEKNEEEVEDNENENKEDNEGQDKQDSNGNNSTEVQNVEDENNDNETE